MSPNKTLIVIAPSLLSLFLVGGLFGLHGIDEENIRLSIRWTARISFFVFIIIFLLRPLNQCLKSNLIRTHLKLRRQWGLGFGLNHIVHYGTIVLLIEIPFQGNWSAFLEVGALPAYLIFVYMLFMMLSSNARSIKFMGAKNWKYFHTGGIYLLAIAFFTSFLPKALGDIPHSYAAHEPLLYVFVCLSLIAAWLLRIYLWFKKRQAK